ncbi:MAG: CRISPR-associated endonuclease Cas2 [Methylobacter tundripaludum]|nr:CRISPR-associated endonuclease Cas2 [Methylobacter tundripaludum]
MADSKRAHFLICYDIADPKRLGRVHRCLKKRGLPVQYSVFTTEMKRIPLEKLLATINLLINQREDDVRCYILPDSLEFDVLGKQFFPEGVMLFSALGNNRLIAYGAKEKFNTLNHQVTRSFSE